MAAIEITIRPLRESDLPDADRIYRLAFGQFIGLPDPMTFAGDTEYVRTRWLADPASALGAESASELIGSNFLTNWGSVGFFGPLTIRPDFWGKGVASRLLEPTMDIFAEWGTKLAGLYTFAQSAKHVHLYQKFGFWPQFLTAVRGLEKLVAGVSTARVAAYRRMLARGFRSFTQGVAMLRSEDQGYNRPDVYVIDDWR